MIDDSPVSGDVATRQNPKPGDKVRIVFEAEWADEFGDYRVYDPAGGFKHTIPPSAMVEVLERSQPVNAASSKWTVDDNTAWQELTAERAGDLFATLAEAARRHGVMVNISVSPYESDVDVE